MTAKIISLNGYKEGANYELSLNDRKRIFMRMLGSIKVENERRTLKEKFLSLIGYKGDTRSIDEEIGINNPIIFGMSDKEFAILRSIMDADYRLSGFEELTNEEQNKFLIKCTKIFYSHGQLTLNAYLSYCKRKCENYSVNNFGNDFEMFY